LDESNPDAPMVDPEAPAEKSPAKEEEKVREEEKLGKENPAEVEDDLMGNEYMRSCFSREGRRRVCIC
jgi:hypothetical protein